MTLGHWARGAALSAGPKSVSRILHLSGGGGRGQGCSLCPATVPGRCVLHWHL